MDAEDVAFGAELAAAHPIVYPRAHPITPGAPNFGRLAAATAHAAAAVRRVAPLAVEPERSCGSCQACCTALGVRDVPRPDGTAATKAPFTRCEHQCDQGCGIYETRPAPCVRYQCGWLLALPGMALTQRPDRLGVIFDRLIEDGPINAREVWRGAFDRPAVRRVLRTLHQGGLLVHLIPFMGRKLPTGVAL